MAEEYVVAEHERDWAIVKKIGPDKKRLGEAFGLRLNRVAKADPPLTTIAK